MLDKFPNLAVVVDRLLDIYCQLTGDKHHVAVAAPGPQNPSEDRPTMLEGRGLSLRYRLNAKAPCFVFFAKRLVKLCHHFIYLFIYLHHSIGWNQVRGSRCLTNCRELGFFTNSLVCAGLVFTWPAFDQAQTAVNGPSIALILHQGDSHHVKSASGQNRMALLGNQCRWRRALLIPLALSLKLQLAQTPEL